MIQMPQRHGPRQVWEGNRGRCMSECARVCTHIFAHARMCVPRASGHHASSGFLHVCSLLRP